MAGHVTGKERPLDVVAVLPPPINGMTLVTQQMVAAFETSGPARMRTASDPTGKRQGLRWTLCKHLTFLGALFSGGLASRGKKACYFVPDSQAGLWLNLLEAPLLRLGYSEVWLHHHVFSYVHSHDWRMALILKIIGSRARHVVLGVAMEEGLRTHYGAEHLHMLGNADFVRDVPSPHHRARLETVGFLGNITREKGINLFLETATAAQAADPTLRVRIAGPVADPTLRAEIEAFCAADPDRRTWLGPVRGAEKTAFFEEIDLLLFPSLYPNEALPVTIYEALAAGTPVLATPRGCIPGQIPEPTWLLPETDFAAHAVKLMAEWCAVPATFAAASKRAASAFQAQKEADRASLAALVETVFRR